ncbi:MAG TPA: hypothetical protein VM223_13205 [Planctomycetota bacterium]|nr:hypothetical protein [Planctomycetota bacterium]
MNRQFCIYYRPAAVCDCVRLAHCKPHCPWYHHGECSVAGAIGRQGVLSNQRPGFLVNEPAPTLMRWRA